MQNTLSHTGAHLVLILGGARSGKSTFAEKLAASARRPVAFIATATASDEEMRARIARHQEERPQGWQTIEEPLDLAGAVRRAGVLADVLLLDCLTLWTSNWLLTRSDVSRQGQELLPDTRLADGPLAEIEAMLRAADALSSHHTLIIVSNEVGLGLVPEYPLGRAYRDILGYVNQRVARAAERVYLMVAGIAVDLKRLQGEASL
jgi:adenosylcobinamide kinase/adenosylcobinamide-phosphate guanylyltransferase